MGPRLHTPELLDQPEQDPAELAASLRQVAQVNRLFGGARALRRHLRSLLGGRARILDVGTGNGETAGDLAAWAAAHGSEWRITGLDLHEVVIGVAHREAPRLPHAPHLVRGDALLLPFRDRTFDAVCCTLTLHHFRDGEAVRLVAEMARVASGVVLVNDLERHMLNYASARVLSWTLWRGNRLTRNDGPLSVLRSFTADELMGVGARSGLGALRVRRHFPWRLVMEGRPAEPEKAV
jgi:SAM-dependent methyltransferase